jgi:hypothetical protein
MVLLKSNNKRRGRDRSDESNLHTYATPMLGLPDVRRDRGVARFLGSPITGVLYDELIPALW